ncbi:MAG: protein kinase [Myxococcales bacterium]|nr:protein kinase [Myxococcales bacterium]
MVDDPLLGRTVLGKYRIERIIGSGGMGTVYEAEDLRLGRPVAIKVLRPAAGDFGDMGRRFRREARTIAQVTHPNLVTLLEFDLLDDGTPAMVMERVEGGSLRELMQRRPVTVDEVVEILRQSLSALGACHEAGIIHRDLKPGNLLVEDRGGELRVKIIDFGLTKITSAGGSVLTAQGEIFGSPRFMAPEQWMGQEVDGRTDLYALGLIGYYLLLGRHFIQPGNPVDVCRAHVQQPRPVLTHDQAGHPVPAAVNDALLRATMPVRDRRFPDAQAMRQALIGRAPSLEAMPRIDLAAEAALRIAPPSEAPGPMDDAATLMDDGLAARVLQAARDPSGSVDSAPVVPPISPRVSLSDAERVRRDDSIDLATRPVPSEAANAITTIDRAEFEAALRATAEQQRPEREARADRPPRSVDAAPSLPSTPALRAGHPTRPAARPIAAPAAAAAPPIEEEGGIRLWMLIVAGLVAAGTAAAVVLLLK